jgi:hypothetical protein
MVTGIALPHGATITQLTMYYKDNDRQKVSSWMYQGDNIDFRSRFTLVASLRAFGSEFMSVYKISLD